MRNHLEEEREELGWVPYDPAFPVGVATKDYDPLWIRPAQMELTGKGRVIGIIDRPLYQEHPGYKDNILSIKNIAVSNPVTDSHGAAVVSIAVGEIGIAKDAQVVYRAFDPMEQGKYLSNLVGAFESLKDYVMDGGHIDAISTSHGWMDTTPGAKETDTIVGWFEDRNIPVFSTAKLQKITFCGPDGLVEWMRQEAMKRNMMEGCLQSLSLPINNRALACFCPEQIALLDSNYYRETKIEGGASWAIPFLAGLFANAREARPDITKDDFLSLLDASSKIIAFPREPLRVLDVKRFVETAKKEKNTRPYLG